MREYLKLTAAVVAMISIGIQYFFVLFQPAGATVANGVLISEVYPDPLKSQEYVEIYNSSEAVVSLDGLEIYDVSSPEAGACENWGKLSSLSGELGAYEYRVVYLASARLNNNGDRISLRKTSGETLDELSYGVCGEINSAKGFTLGRVVMEPGSEILKLSPTPSGPNYLLEILGISIEGETLIDAQILIKASVTKTPNDLRLIQWQINNSPISEDRLSFEYLITSDSEYTVCLKVEDEYKNSALGEIEFSVKQNNSTDYNNIQLSEVFPSPADGISEWIELYNASDQTINLKGLVLDDILNGGSSPYVFGNSHEIQPKEYMIVSRSESKIAFNNGGDDVVLVLPGGETLFKMTYPIIKTDFAYVLYEGEWVISDQPTPGEPNMITYQGEPEQDEVIDIAVAKERVEINVRIRGSVTAATGEVGTNIAYVQDASAGIKVKTSSELLRGKSYELQGKILVAWGETYINALEVTEIDKLISVKPMSVRFEKPDLTTLSSLVKIQGVVKKVNSGSIWVAKNEESETTFKVYIASGLDWKRPEWVKKGAYIEATGVLSQWGLNSNDEPNLRILPRNEKDLKALSSDGKVLGVGSFDLPKTFEGLAAIPGIVGLGSGVVIKLARKLTTLWRPRKGTVRTRRKL